MKEITIQLQVPDNFDMSQVKIMEHQIPDLTHQTYLSDILRYSEILKNNSDFDCWDDFGNSRFARILRLLNGNKSVPSLNIMVDKNGIFIPNTSKTNNLWDLDFKEIMDEANQPLFKRVIENEEVEGWWFPHEREAHLNMGPCYRESLTNWNWDSETWK